MSKKPELTESAVYLHRGLARFALGSFTLALEDFKSISDTNLDSLRHNNIGACYFQLGLTELAIEECTEALKSDSNWAEPYFNLALIYNQKDDNERAEKMLQTCVTIRPNFSPAKVLLKQLKETASSDWYDWWFRSGKVKAALGILLGLALFGMIIMTALAALFQKTSIGFYLFPFLSVSIKLRELSSSDVAALALAIVPLFVLLILRHIEHIKFGGVELKVNPLLAKPPRLTIMTHKAIVSSTKGQIDSSDTTSPSPPV